MKILDEIYAELRCIRDINPTIRPDQSIPGFPEHIMVEQKHTVIIAHSINARYLESKDGQYFAGLADMGTALGIRVIQIWEDHWVTKRPIITSRLNSLFDNTNRLYGRLTSIKKLSQEHLDEFLNLNHLQGPARAKYKYGLFHADKLAAVASFSRARTIPRSGIVYQSFEWIRYCSGLNVTVTGGPDKLLKHFIRQIEPDDIMTYADRDWGIGLAFGKLGFDVVGITSPVSFWVEPVSLTRIFPNKIKHHLMEQGWDQETNEIPEKILIARGYKRVFNAGNIKYLMKLKKND